MKLSKFILFIYSFFTTSNYAYKDMNSKSNAKHSNLITHDNKKWEDLENRIKKSLNKP